MKIDLILQGPVYPYTKGIIESYLDHPLTENVILSCWTTCKDPGISNSRLKIIRCEDPEHPGIGNINRQLVTSLAGIEYSQNEYCAKMRTDQLIRPESLTMMHSFFNKFKEEKIPYTSAKGPLAPIFVIGMYTRFAFHPRDHVFWGMKQDLLDLFRIPKCSFPDKVPGFVKHSENYWRRVIRPESYIGMHYYSNFDSRIKTFIQDPGSYIVDEGSKHQEAMEVYNELRDKVFKVFPKISMAWPKYNLQEYHYHVGQSLSEYWFEKPW